MDDKRPDVRLVEHASLQGVFILGRGGRRFDIEIRDGRFASISDSASGAVDGDLWISPGLIDLHTHLAWTDFHHADQLRRAPAEVENLQSLAFEATIRAGVTTVRDAGGLNRDAAGRLVERSHHPLRVLVAGVTRNEQEMKEAVQSGAAWIKILATGGLGAPRETVMAPLFSRERFRNLVHAAHTLGVKVFVHTWGGATVDWAIEAGVDSVEHGIYLTAEQAGRMAEAGIPLVPTAAIYRLLSEPKGFLDPGPLFRERAAYAAEAHRSAVSVALREGVRIGFGTDFATPALHGRNMLELDALADYGLPWDEAWRAATVTGAEILGLGRELGCIRDGHVADALLFSVDPLKTTSAGELSCHLVSLLVGDPGTG